METNQIKNLKKNDEITLTVEKLVHEGAGLAKIDGFPVFIEDSCPGDVVKAKIVVANKSFARAEIIEILEPSKHRVKPFCPVHNVCGGCGWQFIDYDCQIEQKRNIVEETVKKITGSDIEVLPVIKSPETREFRAKIQYPVAQTKVSKRILAGYYKKGTHELVNIKYCPIQPMIINKITEFLRDKAQELEISGYNEKKHVGELRHIIFRYSKSKNECIIIFVVNNTKLSSRMKLLANAVMGEYAHVKGCCINYNDERKNTIISGETRCIMGDKFYFETVGDVEYKISANSFFQINLGTAKNIFDKVKEIVTENYPDSRILDAYSGVSSFGLYLKDVVKEVVCVEENESASNDAIENVKLNNAQNFKILNGKAKATFERLVDEEEKFDVIILDPPRKGCDNESLDYAIKLAEKAIIYVSCNPSTLARDIKYLQENGFRAKFIQPFDMFCHTYHVESLCLLEKIQ